MRPVSRTPRTYPDNRPIIFYPSDPQVFYHNDHCMQETETTISLFRNHRSSVSFLSTRNDLATINSINYRHPHSLIRCLHSASAQQRLQDISAAHCYMQRTAGKD